MRTAFRHGISLRDASEWNSSKARHTPTHAVVYEQDTACSLADIAVQSSTISHAPPDSCSTTISNAPVDPHGPEECCAAGACPRHRGAVPRSDFQRHCVHPGPAAFHPQPFARPCEPQPQTPPHETPGSEIWLQACAPRRSEERRPAERRRPLSAIQLEQRWATYRVGCRLKALLTLPGTPILLDGNLTSEKKLS